MTQVCSIRLVCGRIVHLVEFQAVNAFSPEKNCVNVEQCTTARQMSECTRDCMVLIPDLLFNSLKYRCVCDEVP